jgi:hypothetical protein
MTSAELQAQEAHTAELEREADMAAAWAHEDDVPPWAVGF